MNHSELVSNLKKPGQEVLAGFDHHRRRMLDIVLNLSAVSFGLASLVIRQGKVADIQEPSQADFLHMVVGVSGECGELLDAVKKYAIYGKVLDRANIIEEAGDLEFYMEGVRQNNFTDCTAFLEELDRWLLSLYIAVDVSRDVVIQHNIDKLTTRYPDGRFTIQHAQARLDKVAATDT